MFGALHIQLQNLHLFSTLYVIVQPELKAPRLPRPTYFRGTLNQNTLRVLRRSQFTVRPYNRQALGLQPHLIVKVRI